ncbi:MAG: four helix bundle protein [Candidatus Binatia bacterium]
MVAQLRRSATSVPSNIAEACGRSSQSDFLRVLHIAMGSAAEVEYQLLLSHDLGFLGDSDYHLQVKLVTEVKRMLASLMKKVKAEG